MRTFRPSLNWLLPAVAFSLAACGGAGASTGSAPAAPTSAAVSGATSSATTAPTPTTASAAAATTAPTPTTAAVATPAVAASSATATVAGTPASAAATPASASTASATASTAGAAASGATLSFKTDIQPIFTTNCTPCHITTKTKGLSLATYDGVMAGGQDGVVVKAGDPNGSLLVQKIKGTQTIGARMPYNKPPLPDDQIQKISDWVAQGAKDN